MASESGNRDTIFPGSDPHFFKELTPLSDPTPPTTTKPSYNFLNKHITRHGSQNSWTPSPSSPGPAKRLSRDGSSSPQDGNKVTGSKRTRIEPRIGTSPRVAYHEFMVLDQAGSAIIGCDNTRERNLVAIKRLKGIDKSSARGIRPFTSDYVVNI